MAKKQQTEQQPERQERDETTVEKLDRTAAANAVLAAMDDDETTLAELAKKADALFVERGDGKSNIDRAEWEVWRSIRALEAMGLLETEDSEIVVRKVRKRPDEVARAASFSAPAPAEPVKEVRHVDYTPVPRLRRAARPPGRRTPVPGLHRLRSDARRAA